MIPFLVRRILQSLLVLLLVSMVTFSLIHAAPGGPVQIFLRPGLSPELVQAQIHNLGLDRPLPVQYLEWLGRLLRGDFGTTFKTGTPVGQILWPTLKNTVILMTTAWVLTLLIAIPWGIYNSTRPYGLWDTVAAVLGYAGFALPAFWFGIILQQIFALRLGVLPLSDMHTIGRQGDLLDLIRHMVLPVTTLVVINLAGYLKYARASMLEVLGQDYIRTARAKGASERRVIFRHALRNALIPIVTVLGLDLPGIVAGATLTETVFNWPGMGRLFVQMAFAREYPVLMAITVVTTAVVVLGNLLADVLYAVVDPRVRLGVRGTEPA
ncbi:ABC transporter permease [Caldinitratiruptor microaerophilus]|uniref:Oligopeptide transport system permease protein AppB n=1 Tax=Caldinitratiruptor microaerophilus TaxID=671077 RepID=A0AA35CM29_9FIRM|nr:ABC transporter permease [Caldinitratiruptor microaerophilus]BDG61829.1 oligopeptide transport system permease protein AppB [Caldinitratiruptor microaerophilus]